MWRVLVILLTVKYVIFTPLTRTPRPKKNPVCATGYRWLCPLYLKGKGKNPKNNTCLGDNRRIGHRMVEHSEGSLARAATQRYLPAQTSRQPMSCNEHYNRLTVSLFQISLFPWTVTWRFNRAQQNELYLVFDSAIKVIRFIIIIIYYYCCYNRYCRLIQNHLCALYCLFIKCY